MMYIHIPKAPLEINIPALTHNRILDSLGLTAAEKQTGSDAIPKFTDLCFLPTTEATSKLDNIIRVYDEAFKHVCSIIEQDVFPRFRKSEGYQNQKQQQVKFEKDILVTTSEGGIPQI